MTANDIKYFLRLKYSREWAFYEEFRPFTGYAGNVSQIDAIAVGMYEKNEKIIAFEIKVNRADFLNDISQFQYKHRFALKLSHEFYYVCPWGLIDKNEIPDVAGLLYINKGNKISRIKVAPIRTFDSIKLCYLQAFLQNSRKRINYAEIPVKYLGKEWTQQEFMEEINRMIEKQRSDSDDCEINRRVREKLKKDGAYCEIVRDLFNHAGLAWMYEERFTEAISKIKKMIDNGKTVNSLRVYAQNAIDRLSYLLDKK